MRTSIYILMLLIVPGITWADKGKEIYMKVCSDCHHSERYGLTAPPLIPETLKKYDRDALSRIIADGLASTQMPSYKEVLSKAEINDVITYILSPAEAVRWGMKEISSSREIYPETDSGDVSAASHNIYGLMREYAIKGSESENPSPVDLENITLVVESGKGITVLDGNDFHVLDRFQAGAIHGGPKFSHSLRYVYAAARDGRITKYDLKRLEIAGRVRGGINTRNIAVSDDDSYIAVANYLPENIAILDQDLNARKIIDVEGKIGGIYLLHEEKKFLCSFREKKELWLIDYEKEFDIMRLELPEPFEDIAVSPLDEIIIGASRNSGRIYLYDIKDKKVLGSIETTGMPHLASATFWLDDAGNAFAAVNHLKKPVLTIIDLKKMIVSKEIDLAGTGYFVRTHQDTPYIWADTNSDLIEIIDKKEMKVFKTLAPAKGNKVMHTEFTKDGKYALVSLWEDDGAVIIYDAYELEEIKRMPFRKPAGKYNAMNKTFPARAFILPGDAQSSSVR